MNFKKQENQEKYLDLMIKIASLNARILRKIYIKIHPANAYRNKENKGLELQMQNKIIGVKEFATYALTIRFILKVLFHVNFTKKEIKRGKILIKNIENISSAGVCYAWVKISGKTKLKNMVIITFQITNLPVAKHVMLLIKARKSL